MSFSKCVVGEPLPYGWLSNFSPTIWLCIPIFLIFLIALVINFFLIFAHK